ncbi:hypothetical protein AAC387_Pa10g1734 [Persea americana]
MAVTNACSLIVRFMHQSAWRSSTLAGAISWAMAARAFGYVSGACLDVRTVPNCNQLKSAAGALHNLENSAMGCLDLDKNKILFFPIDIYWSPGLNFYLN